MPEIGQQCLQRVIGESSLQSEKDILFCLFFFTLVYQENSGIGKGSNIKDLCMFACVGFQNILKYKQWNNL